MEKCSNRIDLQGFPVNLSIIPNATAIYAKVKLRHGYVTNS